MKVLIKDLIKQFPECEFRGDESLSIENAIALKDSLGQSNKSSVSWISDKVGESINPLDINLGLLISSEETHKKIATAKCNFLISENPRSTFVKILSIYFKKTWPQKVERSAIVHDNTKIGSNCYIGHHVVIEENCTIGNNSVILHNTTILANTAIGNNVVIGCNNTIGNYGFGYEKDSNSDYQLMQHLGKVIIHDNVEIHNNTCIDRGVLSDTEIHENVKIDNLVHVAHGVVIGRNSLIIANVMIGGSTKIGENVWVAPSVSLKNQITIADNTNTGIGAVILKDTKENSLVIGNPAITMDEHKKWSEVRKKLLAE
jgi:UDP-3-O-[3-hydroxymyristoyl] glucosamine N-acyltransferase